MGEKTYVLFIFKVINLVLLLLQTTTQTGEQGEGSGPLLPSTIDQAVCQVWAEHHSKI